MTNLMTVINELLLMITSDHSWSFMVHARLIGTLWKLNSCGFSEG